MTRRHTQRQFGPAVTPFPGIVLIDDREKAPFSFTGFVSDAKQGCLPIAVTTRTAHLPAGDYSLDGLTSRIAVERKSLADLFNTIGQNRERFERELTYLDAMSYAAVVVEADWDAVLTRPPPDSHLPPKIIFRSVIAWQQRFPRVHWWLMPGRRLAETVCLRILERFARENLTHAQPGADADSLEGEPAGPLPGVPGDAQL